MVSCYDKETAHPIVSEGEALRGRTLKSKLTGKVTQGNPSLIGETAGEKSDAAFPTNPAQEKRRSIVLARGGQKGSLRALRGRKKSWEGPLKSSTKHYKSA